jgi:hypothetical protein
MDKVHGFNDARHHYKARKSSHLIRSVRTYLLLSGHQNSQSKGRVIGPAAVSKAPGMPTISIFYFATNQS